MVVVILVGMLVARMDFCTRRFPVWVINKRLHACMNMIETNVIDLTTLILLHHPAAGPEWLHLLFAGKGQGHDNSGGIDRRLGETNW